MGHYDDSLAFKYGKACTADHAAILGLYRSLVGTPYCIWDDEYPDADETREDLAAGRVRCLTAPDGTLAATISIEPGDEDFLALHNWKTDGRFAVLARLGVSKAYQGRGLARFMMEHAMKETKDAGYTGVRFIVYVDHEPAISLYRSMDVDFLGHATLYELDWYCCEKRF